MATTGAFRAVGLLAVLAPGMARAHATDQAFVLLLPTGVYTAVGVAVVAVTFALMALVPETAPARWRATRRLPVPSGKTMVSLASTGVFFALLGLGVFGTRDPTANPLPLVFWVVFWSAFVAFSGVAGSVWDWVNPWAGVVRVLRGLGVKAVLQVPDRVADVVACASLLAFAGFLLADPAPSDPARLARLAALYWLGTLVVTLVCGPVWLARAELFAVLLRWIGAVSPFDWSCGRVGWPGWQIIGARGSAGYLLFPLLVLGVGSFDGLNETFLWLGWLGINPLEFPGRSAVVVPNLVGLGGAIALLLALFFFAAWLGQRLAGPVPGAMLRLAPTVLPIALAYHVAHYLPGFLVDIQYVVGMIARMVGAAPPVVTTGFFFDPGPVRLIWMAQGTAVTLGHAYAIWLAHLVALELYATHRRAVLSQLPMGVFMIAYTFFGLWLLAAPKGA